eukprot:CAMPEP_0170592828 /NCGR_PEP_ID=MMETSP0224-20130122/13127_1 /TAXON_ID=285029 /ORGANISM="Togula jolla, Strain CCCM 725" /LENGTH=46 /DNA_ID= /DNA_START= /DNA_END= /DNA_ORIENTATION=
MTAAATQKASARSAATARKAQQRASGETAHSHMCRSPLEGHCDQNG